jgi:Zn-finger nucleic acid-binding protein
MSPPERLKCPLCATRMTQVDARGATIDWCEFCQGLWFDPTELVRVLSARRPLHRETRPFERALPVRGRSGLSCPRCRAGLMEAVGWDGLSFTRCPRCRGLYLDRPQVEAVRAHFRSGEETMSSGKVGDAITRAGQALSGVAELLWTVARAVGRVKLGGPP